MLHVTRCSPCNKDISVYARYTSIFLYLQNNTDDVLSTVLLLCILGFDFHLCEVHFYHISAGIIMLQKVRNYYDDNDRIGVCPVCPAITKCFVFFSQTIKYSGSEIM